MAGIYIHIPFCRQKCCYCDFYSIIKNKLQAEDYKKFVESLIREIEEKSEYLNGEEIETIYFGGGTPSLLEGEEINKILYNIYKYYNVAEYNEISFEANPDDLNGKYIDTLIQCGINRISIGIQSFDNKILKFLNRRHDAKQAEESVLLCKEKGLNNISADIIFGIPKMTLKQWKQTVERVFELHIPHISAYMLTYEHGTDLKAYLNKGIIKEIDEEEFVDQYCLLMKITEEHYFYHYEISNFALPGFCSTHNSNYWKQEKYIGIGPSAHSFNGNERQWNVSDVGKYINSISIGSKYFEKELLDRRTKFNEYIITSLRTVWGINMQKIIDDFGKEYLTYLHYRTKEFFNLKLMERIDNKYVLTTRGKLISDYVFREIIITDDMIIKC